MPFDFMSRSKHKDKGPSDAAPARSKKKELVGDIEGFDAQSRALVPSEDKGKGALSLLKSGHPLDALKQAFGKGDKNDKAAQVQPANPALVGQVDDVRLTSSSLAAAARSLTYQIGNVLAEAKDGGHESAAKQALLSRLSRGRRAGQSLVDGEMKLHAAAMDWERKGGSLLRVQTCLDVILKAAKDMHTVLYGHPGPDDYKTPDAMLYQPINPDDKLVGGRSKSSEEARNKGVKDTRTGPVGEYTGPRIPQMQTNGKLSLGCAVYSRSVEWVDSYNRFVEAMCTLGTVI